LDRDIESSPKRWKKLVECECPEREKFPQEWKNKTALQRLCMLRALRPDRMTYAILAFIEEKLGPRYVEGRTVEFAKSFEETSPTTPIFFILSPGVNPLKVSRCSSGPNPPIPYNSWFMRNARTSRTWASGSALRRMPRISITSLWAKAKKAWLN
jgi:hypothetical protein